MPITEFPLPTGSKPSAIITGQDGNIWAGDENLNCIWRMTLQGVVTKFQLPDLNTEATGLAWGSDGGVWVTEGQANKICRFDQVANTWLSWTMPFPNSLPTSLAQDSAGNWNITLSGLTVGKVLVMSLTGTVVTVIILPAGPGCLPQWPVLGVGLDGDIWLSEVVGNKLVDIDPLTHQVTEFPLPHANSRPTVETVARDGFYFPEIWGNRIGRSDVNGVITEWPVPTPGSSPYGCCTGSDGNIYFTERAANKIGMLPVGGGKITEWTIPTANSQPNHLTLGPDGHIWWTEAIGKIATM